MLKPPDPRRLAIDILARSICSVQVGAAIVDISGRIISWGWNSVGAGMGMHAEHHAIRRANKRRLEDATIYVASQRHKNGKAIGSCPCGDCMERIRSAGITGIYYRLANGTWEDFYGA